MQGIQEALERSNEFRNQQQTYKKIKVLGEGSMGKAYLVECSIDKKLYVMKRINIGHLSEQQKEKALLQAQLHSQLKHKNIIEFHQIYHTTKDKLCLIMEYAQEGDLDQLITKQQKTFFDQDTILKLFTQICLGVKEIHDHKILHRDLKGANIFITGDGTLKIGDFGISKMLDQTILASKSFVGTPYYLSPEMVQGKPYSTKADIWALGVVLYHMAALKLPFQTNSLPLLALKIIKGSFPPLSAGNYSKQFKNLVLSLLQVDQKKRPTINQILSKPILQKYIPKDLSHKLVQQKIEVKGVKSTVKPLPKKVKLSEEEIKEKEKAKKEEYKEKREEMRKQMREDLKKKRKQAEKTPMQRENLQINSSTIELKPKQTKSDKRNKKLEQNQKKIQKEQIPSNLPKPWKNKKPVDKKDIQIQMYLPQSKAKPSKVIQQNQSTKDFKVQIFVSSKPPLPRPKSNLDSHQQQNMKKKQNLQQIILSNNQIKQNQKSQESISEQQLEQDNIQQNIQKYNINDLLKDVRGAGQLVKNLNNPFGPIQLYEESQQFQNLQSEDIRNNQSEVMKNQSQKISKEDQQNMKYITNSSENLQQLRQILQDRLGEDNLLKSYNILKQHIEEAAKMALQHRKSQESVELGQQPDSQDYTFNRLVLRNKLDFLSDEDFDRNLVLLFSLTILQDEEMQRNIEDVM